MAYPVRLQILSNRFDLVNHSRKVFILFFDEANCVEIDVLFQLDGIISRKPLRSYLLLQGGGVQFQAISQLIYQRIRSFLSYLGSFFGKSFQHLVRNKEVPSRMIGYCEFIGTEKALKEGQRIYKRREADAAKKGRRKVTVSNR